MRIYENGTYREATEEENAEFERMAASIPPPEPTPEERLAKLEEKNAHLTAQLAAYEAAYMEGVNEA